MEIYIIYSGISDTKTVFVRTQIFSWTGALLKARKKKCQSIYAVWNSKWKRRLYIVPPLLIHSIWKVSIKLDSKKADRHANIDMGFPDPRCEGVLFEKQCEMEEKCFLVPIENLYRSFL